MVTSGTGIAQSLKVVSTLVAEKFFGHADRYGVTPEYLLSVVTETFTRNAPDALNVVSGAPLNEQSCATCPMNAHCGSRHRREREGLLCYERLVS